MAYELRPMVPADLLYFADANTTIEDIVYLYDGGKFSHYWSAFRDGALISCCGIMRLWTGRGEACVNLADSVNRWDMLRIYRWTLEKIIQAEQELDLRRVEATTKADWPPGERWLRMLGFTEEGRLRFYGPDGRDHMMWARYGSSSGICSSGRGRRSSERRVGATAG